MRKGFYARLAAQNIKKNGKFYLPYLLTAAGCAAMLYTMYFLNGNAGVGEMSGSAYVRSFLALGTVVITIFSAVLIFYTNSFLMKRRKKELGLYNVLGMGKRHIARFLFWETVYTALIGVIGGLALGVLLSKLALLALCRLLGAMVPFGFELSATGMVATAASFLVIFLLCLLGNLRRIGKSRPIELLHGENTGDREPKTRWFLAVVGVLSLGGGYVIASMVRDAIAALGLFFVAVLLVILGTFCLFTAGSIAVLKALRRNKRYYYQTKHFTAVAGMLHRMKRNAAGLAAVCILSTMVLVTVSTTASLYLGTEDSLDQQYPRDYQVIMFKADENAMNSLVDAIERVAEEDGVKVKNLTYFAYYEGNSEVLSANQECGDALKATNGVNGVTVWAGGDEDYLPTVYVGYDLPDGADTRLTSEVSMLCDSMEGDFTYEMAYMADRASNAEDLYAMSGGFFFIGLYLGFLFLMATALIIYYKQVSEGYEDAQSYRIMQNVGMTQREVRESIHGQIMTVFFLPLAAAGVHIAFAFNMISRLLTVFGLYNVPLFAWCTVGVFAAFALVYALVYALTARAYYGIVKV